MKPLLIGHESSYFSTGAKDSFQEVLIRAMDVQRSGRLGTSYTDTATELANAVDKASLWCNEELLRRMHIFRDAVLDHSRGDGSEGAADEARAFFMKGCRQALGTDK